MWNGFDAETRRQLAMIKDTTARRARTPVHEWPVIFVEAQNSVLVVREYGNGEVTAYLMPRS